MAVRTGLVGALVGVTILLGCDSDAPRSAGGPDASTDHGTPAPTEDARPRESGVRDAPPEPTRHPDVGPPPTTPDATTPDAHAVPDAHDVPDGRDVPPEPPPPDASPDAPPKAPHLL